MEARVQAVAGPGTSAPEAERRAFLDLDFDLMTLDDTLRWIAARGPNAPFAYVVTPNVDHMVRLPGLEGPLRAAYREADLCLCDSRVLARIARACGVALPVVPGSDLTARLLGEALTEDSRVLLIGGEPGDADLLAARYPHLRFRQHVPPMGLRHDAAARRRALNAAAGAEVILLAVGSPQQELLAYEMRTSRRVTGTALCIGASVNFLVGKERRAPRLVQRLSLEWAWRLVSNPGRMARRYLRDDPKIFAMAWAWQRRRRGGLSAVRPRGRAG